jgi:ABC-type dipeptide/oligopeptide/nickel transport system ATPase component
MPLLTVENLSVEYRSHGAIPRLGLWPRSGSSRASEASRGTTTRAVDRVSFSVEPGEVVALVGESGSGKSSVALAITRLLPSPPAFVTGRVVFDPSTPPPPAGSLGIIPSERSESRDDGSELLTMSDAALRSIRGGKIAYVFQDPATSLNPLLTVGEQLTEAIVLHTPMRGVDAGRAAAEWLARVGIREAAERLSAYPHELSGGMQQRVMLAMAMAAAPRLLIADEPTTALDVTVQVQILRLVRELQQTFRLAVLLISHDLLVVERLAHRVWVLWRGRVIEHGETASVLRHPAHEQTKRLLQARALMTLRRGRGDG